MPAAPIWTPFSADPLWKWRQKKPETVGEKKEALRDLAREFEAIILEGLFKQMYKSAILLSGEERGFERSLWEDMWIKTYTRQVVSRGGIGLSDMIYNALVRDL